MDRSPCGSGVTARVALHYHKGLIQINQTRVFQNGATGSQFTGKAVEVLDFTFFVSSRKWVQVLSSTGPGGWWLEGEGLKIQRASAACASVINNEPTQGAINYLTI